MTIAFLVKKPLTDKKHGLQADVNQQLLMSEESTIELGMDDLVASGDVVIMTEDEALTHYYANAGA